MNNQVELKVVDCSDSNMYYDLNEICETSDSIFWTLDFAKNYHYENYLSFACL